MELRRPARRVTVAELGSDLPAAQDAAEQVALRDWVWAALEDLPEPLRLVTLLRFFGRRHSYAQIAQLCGVPVGTVRSRLHQAKAELGARLLAESGVAPRDDARWTQRVRASYLSLAARVSSAAITVIESTFVNPPDDPRHCPPAVTQVLFHDGTDRVRRSLGYIHPRPPQTPE
jgi:RNA polymerase sigma-70 factor (ECF subfamily)